MENNGWSFEQHNTLVRELIQGMEMAKQLRLRLNSGSSMEARESLIQRILTSYDKALLILNWGQQQQQQNAASAALPVVVVAGGSVPESPISRNGSPGSDDFDGGYVDASKKRKRMPRWTDHVRVSSENGLEGSRDDGYNWRKYGQKDILGAKYPRSYYRCTYRNTQNCWATKQVQRSDEDPNVFDNTYRGAHTCSHGQQSVPPPPSTEKQEHKQNNINNSYQQQQQQQQQQHSQETLFNFQKTLRVDTADLDTKETATFPFSFPPSFISPTTPEPSYYSASPFHVNNFIGAGNLQYADSISTNTSAANSPLAEPDFSLQAL